MIFNYPFLVNFVYLLPNPTKKMISTKIWKSDGQTNQNSTNHQAAFDKKIKKVFAKYAQAVSGTKISRLIPHDATDGKIYEAFVLAHICKKLKIEENKILKLENAKGVALKSGGGPINPKFPHIGVYQGKTKESEIWTDIYFKTMSSCKNALPSSSADHHELDIVIVGLNAKRHPEYGEIQLAAECKHTVYHKKYFRKVLGVRRELSMLVRTQSTCFSNWPTNTVDAYPNSCLLSYSIDGRILKYQDSDGFFGVNLYHLPV